jgi:hypothetical protein
VADKPSEQGAAIWYPVMASPYEGVVCWERKQQSIFAAVATSKACLKNERNNIALFHQDLYNISIDVFDDLVELMLVISSFVCALSVWRISYQLSVLFLSK